MEVIEITTTNKEFRYKAIDGTIFNNESECEKYESTCACVLRSKLKINNSYNAWEVCFAYEESETEIVNGDSDDILKYLAYNSNNYICEATKDFKRLMDSGIKKNDCVIMLKNMENEIYKIITKSEFIDRIEKCCKFEK